MVVALSNALPLTAADGVTGRNNGRDIRKGLLSSLLLPDTKSNPLAVRNGILSHDYDPGGVSSLRLDTTNPPSAQVFVHPGAFVTERTGQGPYIGWLETSSGITITPPAADATNPRIDVVYVAVFDKASISLDPGTDSFVDIVTGVPSATPAVPTINTDGAVTLAQIYRPAASTVITPDRVTDVRRSSGLVGTVRRMLPGDFLSDPGKVDGELRYRQPLGSLPSLVDYWDGSQNRWRGTQGFAMTAPWPGTPDAKSRVGGTPSGNNFLINTTIPDPGWPYRVAASTVFNVDGFQYGATFATSNVVVNNTNVSAIVGTPTPAALYIVPGGSTIYTGAGGAGLNFNVLGGGNATWSADVRNPLTLNIIPA